MQVHDGARLRTKARPAQRSGGKNCSAAIAARGGGASGLGEQDALEGERRTEKKGKAGCERRETTRQYARLTEAMLEAHTKIAVDLQGTTNELWPFEGAERAAEHGRAREIKMIACRLFSEKLYVNGLPRAPIGGHVKDSCFLSCTCWSDCVGKTCGN